MFQYTFSHLNIVSNFRTQNHGLVEVGSDLWSSSGPTPPLKERHLEPVAQDHVQTAFEYLKGGRFHNCSGQRVPVLSHLHSQKSISWFPYGTSHVSVCASCLVTGHHQKSMWLYLPSRFPSEIFKNFLWAKELHLFQPFLIWEMLQSHNHLHDPSLDFALALFVLVSPVTGHSTPCVASPVLSRGKGSPAASVSSKAAQDTIRSLSCKATLSSHNHLGVHQDLQVLPFLQSCLIKP